MRGNTGRVYHVIMRLGAFGRRANGWSKRVSKKNALGNDGRDGIHDGDETQRIGETRTHIVRRENNDSQIQKHLESLSQVKRFLGHTPNNSIVVYLMALYGSCAFS